MLENIQTQLDWISLRNADRHRENCLLKESFFFKLGNTSQSCFSRVATCPVQCAPVSYSMSPKPQSTRRPPTPTLLSHNPPHPRWDCFVLWNFHYVKRIKIKHPVNLWFLVSCHRKYERFRRSETKVRKHSNRSVYTESPQHRGL